MIPKFRAWWKHPTYQPEWKMYWVAWILYWTQCEWEPEYKISETMVKIWLVELGSEYDKIWWNNASDCILMQSTWLKDKNGVEIFEWDVITSLWTQFIVQYDQDWFYAVNGEEYASLCSYTWLEEPYDIDDVEMIWNIYQNPELLTK